MNLLFLSAWPARARYFVLSSAALCYFLPGIAAADGLTEFDQQIIQARGLDPKVAERFREAPRFLSGETVVALTVNGSARGRVKVRFDEQGQFCPDAGFFKHAGLYRPDNISDQKCVELKQSWPQAEIMLDPGELRIDIVVPQQAISKPDSESDNWHHGGTAGLLNYDAQYMGSSGTSSGISFTQLGTEAGFNIDNWIFRSRQTITRFNSEDRFQHHAAYAQRTFSSMKKVIQAGQINLSNSMFGAGQVLGIQFFPETALARDRGGPGVVEGITDTQSVVEVRQSGVLVYSTLVPAGPFRLQGLNLLNVRSDLAVRVINSDGQKRQFTVPASAFLINGSAPEPGLSFGAGRLDQPGNQGSPMLATIATGWQLLPSSVLNIGVLSSSLYQAGAINLDIQPLDATLLTLQATAALDATHNSKGLSLATTVTRQLTERTSINLNVAENSRGGRELSDALQHEDIQELQNRSRRQIGAGLGWANSVSGSWSFSFARSSTFAGNYRDYARAGWSRQFARYSVGLSAERDLGNRYTRAVNRFYISLNMPFGSSRISSYVNNSGSGTRGGIRYNERTSQDRGWSLSTERDFRIKHSSATLGGDFVTTFSQLSGSVSQDTDNRNNWSGRASGALVGHGGGITLSPYRIGDTFGIARVGKEPGVRLETPAGPTWTNSDGYAVLPSVSSFRRSAIQIDTRSLAKSVDIANALQETEAARGSVSNIEFDVVRTRRVLIEVTVRNGTTLPHGASIFDEKGNFVTSTGEGGRVFIPDAAPDMKFIVQSSGRTLCTFALQLPEEAERNSLYETAVAQCR